MKKLSTLLVVIGTIAAFAGPAGTAYADCGSGTSQQTDANGNPTGADTITALPDGGVVYGSTSGYIGVSGPQGYLDVNSSPQVSGSATAAPVSGTLNSGGLVLEGVNCS